MRNPFLPSSLRKYLFLHEDHLTIASHLQFVLMSGGVELDCLICDLATIIGSRGQTFTKQFERSMGGLSIMAEEFRNQQAPTEKMIWYVYTKGKGYIGEERVIDI